VDRLRVRRRKGAILEADELESLIDAAGGLDRRSPGGRARQQRVREFRDARRLSWREIASVLGIASSTAAISTARANRLARPATTDAGP
jgi:hypothetical protein